QTGTNFFAASAEEAVAKIGDRPVLVIHGDKDFMMPLAHSEQLYAAAKGPRELWAGPGMHSNIVTEDPVAYREHVFGFLSRSLFAPGVHPKLSGALPKWQVHYPCVLA
ncbi:MAG: alpha/beta hydrolase, partial [Armatimonadia bacterium]